MHAGRELYKWDRIFDNATKMSPTRVIGAHTGGERGASTTSTSPRPRITILSSHYGGGQQRVAEVLVDELPRRSQGCRVNIYDFVETCIGHSYNSVFSSLYFSSVRWTPWLYRWFYVATSAIPPHSLMQRSINRLGKRRLAAPLRANCPDIAVSTYCLPTEGMSALKREGRTDLPCTTTVTDHVLEGSDRPGL